MLVLEGKGICGGVVFGEISFYQHARPTLERRQISDPEQEIRRLEAARLKAAEELEALYKKALSHAGEDGASIFQIHQMMLDDEDYTRFITETIRSQRVCAEYAVEAASENFSRMFLEVGDAYMSQRAADVKDVSERLITLLLNRPYGSIGFDAPVILAADDLSPSETVQLDRSKILAFVTAAGSSASHTAILAQTMGIPAIIGVGDALWNAPRGCAAIADGETGKVYLEPDPITAAALRKKLALEKERERLLEELKGKPDVTLDGQPLTLHANIGGLADLKAALHYDADGIGLFRSEFLFLEGDSCPSEDKQFSVYKEAAEAMGGKRTVIRTLDIGSDKQTPYFSLPKEENPALGMRGIRFCLANPDIFKTQLRAIYRASVFGKIAVLFPMITSVDEIFRIRKIIAQAQSELESRGIPFSKNVELGVMIETPSSAVISDKLAKEADFFSVGTNDLTQYALAADRQNQSLEAYCGSYLEPVLRLIKMAADNARQSGIRIGICGGLAADLRLTETFLAMGINELSVPPADILRLRKKIRETNAANSRTAALSLLL